MRTNSEIISLIQSKVEERKMSMSELARNVGIAKSTMSRYFNKTREFPLNRADDFAKALNISTEFLLGIDLNSEVDGSELLGIYRELEEQRRVIVLDTAKEQLEEQTKIINFSDKKLISKIFLKLKERLLLQQQADLVEVLKQMTMILIQFIQTKNLHIMIMLLA